MAVRGTWRANRGSVAMMWNEWDLERRRYGSACRFYSSSSSRISKEETQ